MHRSQPSPVLLWPESAPLGLRSSHLTPSHWGYLSSLSPQPFLPTFQAVTVWLSPRFPCRTHSHTSWVCWSPRKWLTVLIWNCMFFFEGVHFNATVNQKPYLVPKAMMYGTLWCRKRKYALWVYTSLLHRNTVFIKTNVIKIDELWVSQRIFAPFLKGKKTIISDYKIQGT